jgi:hypothetical protein
MGRGPVNPQKRKKRWIYLSIQSQAAEKQSLLGVLHSVGLKSCFIKEPNLPWVERGVSSIKDEIVSFFPDLPRPNNEDFHEKIIVEWLPRLFHHGMELEIKSPKNAQMLPTPCTERAGEE